MSFGLLRLFRRDMYHNLLKGMRGQNLLEITKDMSLNEKCRILKQKVEAMGTPKN